FVVVLCRDQPRARRLDRLWLRVREVLGIVVAGVSIMARPCTGRAVIPVMRLPRQRQQPVQISPARGTTQEVGQRRAPLPSRVLRVPYSWESSECAGEKGTLGRSLPASRSSPTV